MCRSVHLSFGIGNFFFARKNLIAKIKITKIELYVVNGDLYIVNKKNCQLERITKIEVARIEGTL